MNRNGEGRLRIVVTGLLGCYPIAGLTAHYLQYVLGFMALGHDVLYLEDTGWFYDPTSRVYVDPWTEPAPAGTPTPASVLAALGKQYGFQDRWTHVDLDANRHGLAGPELSEFLRTADFFIHVTGSGYLREEYLSIPHRVFVDTDPGYVQMRTAAGSDKDLEHLENHTAHFSFGCNIGSKGCRIATLGLTWRPTVQPIHLPMWEPTSPAPVDAALTTVLKWKPYDAVEHEGIVYGMKDVEFMKFWRLPQLTSHPVEIAMDGYPPIEQEELERVGWRIQSGQRVSGSLDAYRDYIVRSRAEWSVAKNGYVATRSGWFSERSGNYLASGRPVIMQSTGFERWLPTGEGVLSFSTLQEAVDSIDSLIDDYEIHCKAAVEIAHEYFDATRVLSRLLEEAAQVGS